MVQTKEKYSHAVLWLWGKRGWELAWQGLKVWQLSCASCRVFMCLWSTPWPLCVLDPVQVWTKCSSFGSMAALLAQRVWELHLGLKNQLQSTDVAFLGSCLLPPRVFL